MADFRIYLSVGTAELASVNDLAPLLQQEVGVPVLETGRTELTAVVHQDGHRQAILLADRFTELHGWIPCGVVGRNDEVRGQAVVCMSLENLVRRTGEPTTGASPSGEDEHPSGPFFAKVMKRTRVAVTVREGNVRHLGAHVETERSHRRTESSHRPRVRGLTGVRGGGIERNARVRRQHGIGTVGSSVDPTGVRRRIGRLTVTAAEAWCQHQGHNGRGYWNTTHFERLTRRFADRYPKNDPGYAFSATSGVTLRDPSWCESSLGPARVASAIQVRGPRAEELHR